jgi:hypothetical protein
MPVFCVDPRVTKWGMETYDEIYPLAKDAQNPLVELLHCVSLKRKHEVRIELKSPRESRLVRFILRYHESHRVDRLFVLYLQPSMQGPSTDDFVADDYHKGTGGKSQLPFWSSDARFNFQNVTLEQVAWQNQIHKLKLPSLSKAQAAGYNHAWFWQTAIVDCPKMLESFLEELDESNDSNDLGEVDLDVETGVYYQSQDELFEEAKKLDCDAIVNCTGMGASKLLGDSELNGARGVMLRYDRSSCNRLDYQEDGPLAADTAIQQHDACFFVDDPPWADANLPIYKIIRGDDVIIGGTFLLGDTETEVRPHERQRLLETARLVGIDTSTSQPKEEWVGFRPYREEIRCEIDSSDSATNDNDGIRLVHCYGSGGSGWTIYTGLSKEATRLVMQ